MISSVLPQYVHNILSHIPWGHWVIMGAMALVSMLYLMLKRKCPIYGAIALGLSVFVGLFLLDTAVYIRYLGHFPHDSGYNLGVDRLIHPSNYGWAELISNVLVFVPFGLFLSEFLSATKRVQIRCQIGFVSLISFGLSLCIECSQLVLGVGYFELTDLLTNSLGGLIGVGVAVLARSVVNVPEKALR